MPTVLICRPNLEEPVRGDGAPRTVLDDGGNDLQERSTRLAQAERSRGAASAPSRSATTADRRR